MNCFELKSPLGVILFAFIINYSGAKPTSGSSCRDMTENSFCAVEKVSILTYDDANKFGFPKEKLLLLRAPTILQAPQALCSRLPKVVLNLEIYDGFVPEICIKSTLKEFKAERNLARKVTVDEVQKYRLEHLVIAKNQLRTVPENINKLTNLVELHLNENEIETVNMDHFKDLARLEVLLLFGNKITQIHTKIPLTLPSLRTLDLSSNLLENLSINQWNFSNLIVIDLQNNKLRKIEHFPEKFPKLLLAYHGHNRWSCTWLDQIVKNNRRAVSFFSQNKDESCSGKQFQGICCEDSLEDQINRIMEKLSEINSTHNQLKEEINWIKEKLNQNRALIDDVVEDLYLEELNKQELKKQTN